MQIVICLLNSQVLRHSKVKVMPIAFSDIQNHWANAAIAELAQRELISGYPDGKFRPDATITRAEFAALLRKAFPTVQPIRSAMTFIDVPTTYWAAPAISTVYAMGFLSGYPDGTFKPNQLLERTQAFVALAKGLKYVAPANPTATVQNYFDDAAQIPNYAIAPVAAAVHNRLIVNYPNIRQLKPLQNATRGEVAAFIAQALKLFETVPPQYVAGVFEISPQFVQANDFYNGLAQVTINNKIGFIDKTGKLVTPKLFDDIGLRAEGLQPVALDSKGGYIDTSAKLVIPPQFDGVEPFSEGLAAVRVGDKFGYIDKTGKFVSQPQFDWVSSFTNNQELARISIDGKIGYIDKSGKIVIQPQFKEAEEFSDGLARVRIDNKFGFIDTTGKVVIPPQFDSVERFSEGLAPIVVNYKYGFIDKTGNVVIQPQFELAGLFDEGLAMMRLGNKAGFINKTGNIVIQPQFDSAQPFSKGQAQVMVNGKLGVIDQTGTFLIPAQFEIIEEFSDGLARVLVPGLAGGVGYIDKTGKLVIPAKFGGVSIFPGDGNKVPSLQGNGAFSEGLAPVSVKNKWGYIDRTGKFVIPPQFEAAFPFSGGLARVNIGGQWSSLSTPPFLDGGKWGYIRNPIK
ncbi:MAG TPA: WG repeat-containing protein [Coleofasciculaceae cyanobacterium]|jgi:hypothetical protein